MPRRARVTLVNEAHHVCQWSFKRRAIFASDRDCQAYLEVLREEARYYKVDILAYCLSRDRVHLVLVPRKRGSLSKVVGRTHFWYAQHLNRRRKRTGTLWHDRFHSCLVDEKYLLAAVQFVECQPVYDRIVRKAEKYQWSSAAAHTSGEDELDILALDVWPSARSRATWARKLSKQLDVETRKELLLHTRTGRPWGRGEFIEALEKKFRRRLHALPVGRPPKSPSSD